MIASPPSSTSRRLQHLARSAMARLPEDTRFALYRRMVMCDARPDARLTLGLAAAVPDLEACFALLHDAYVDSGFMRPHPSGLRVTPYHALPTTTTLCARWDGQVVGTLSIIREGVFGLPMQSVFDLTPLRAKPGRIAEISALAIHPDFRKTGGMVLFPLMKFMYEYCTRYFDTRHLVIAVNPRHIEMYESILFFERLSAPLVANYDFVNGAPAIGATLDLAEAPEVFRRAYSGRRPERDLHRYFTEINVANIQFPARPFHTTSDPVMTPAVLDHFFNQRTQVFDELDERRRLLLRSVYPDAAYAAVLPLVSQLPETGANLRRFRRVSLKCPARLFVEGTTARPGLTMQILDVSRNGFLARTDGDLPVGTRGQAVVEFGADRTASVSAELVRRTRSDEHWYCGFRVTAEDGTWCGQVCELDADERSVRSGNTVFGGIESWADQELALL